MNWGGRATPPSGRRPTLGQNVGVASSPSLRKWWRRTILADFIGIAFLLLGWGLHSDVLLGLGFILLVVSISFRIAAHIYFTISRRR